MQCGREKNTACSEGADHAGTVGVEGAEGWERPDTGASGAQGRSGLGEVLQANVINQG